MQAGFKWIEYHCWNFVVWDSILFCIVFIFSRSPLSVLIFYYYIYLFVLFNFLHKLWKIILHFNPERKHLDSEEATVFFLLLSQLKIKLLLHKQTESVCSLMIISLCHCLSTATQWQKSHGRLSFVNFLLHLLLKHMQQYDSSNMC